MIVIQCRWPVIFVNVPRENKRIGVYKNNTKLYIYILGYARNSVDIVAERKRE